MCNLGPGPHENLGLNTILRLNHNGHPVDGWCPGGCWFIWPIHTRYNKKAGFRVTKVTLLESVTNISYKEDTYIHTYIPIVGKCEVLHQTSRTLSMKWIICMVGRLG